MTTTARARTTDPTTSHAAAQSVRVCRSAGVRAGILYLLGHDARRALSDVEIAVEYGALVTRGEAPVCSPSGLRTRRAELVTRGEVVDTGHRVRLASGRQAIVWALAEQGSEGT